jgi:hypothetical protein
MYLLKSEHSQSDLQGETFQKAPKWFKIAWAIALVVILFGLACFI